MSVLILGAGGHAKVVVDILRARSMAILGFLDDDPATWRTQPMGIAVLGAIETLAIYAPTALVLGVGSNRARQQILERLGPGLDNLWINAIHPTATVSSTVTIGKGTVLMAQAVINADTQVGDHAIVNTAATVDHDCQLGDFCHIAPGAHLAGGVRVGVGALIGIGAAIIPYRSVGDWATVGAGATVVHNVPMHTTVVGTPARQLSKQS